MPAWLEKALPILILLAVIGFVVLRLPRIDVGHTSTFRRRRLLNWLPVGLLYAFLYMGRYNLTVAKGVFERMPGPGGEPLMTNTDFGVIFGIGTAIYGVSFVVNGPLTDRIGGKRALLLGGGGTIASNLAMGLVAALGYTGDLVAVYSILYGANMYFQSFGAVSIVKINAPWFHVRERGVFGAIFGILISLGIYFAFDVGDMIVSAAPVHWVFFVPALLLGACFLVVMIVARDTPGQVGLVDFDTADASSGDEGPPLRVVAVFKKMLGNPVIMTIACIEFCSGFLRQAIMQWYRTYARSIGQDATFVYENWGMLLCCAGISGGVFAGFVSDHAFGSRRGPVAALLYAMMLVGAVVGVYLLGHPLIGPLVVFMSMCVIGVHGMLSGTASMDFGGRKNAGVAVGIIDGFVYAGTAAMSFTYAALLPEGEARAVVDDWIAWPVAMVPVATVGLVLALRVRNARPTAERPPA